MGDDTPEEDAGMDEDLGGLMGALRRLAQVPGIQEEVDDLLVLYALNGVPDVPAARAVVELYSPLGLLPS